MTIEHVRPPSIDEQMATLFAKFCVPETEEDIRTALVAQATLIRTIAQACERTAVHRMASEKIVKFRGDLEASTPAADRLIATWNHFLNSLVESPTAIHRTAAVRLYLPMVASYLPCSGGDQ